MLCCMPSIPLGGEFCINKDVLIFASEGPLIWFFLDNNKLECDTLTHRKKKNGKKCTQVSWPTARSDKENKTGKECEEIKCNVNIAIIVWWGGGIVHQ